MIHLRKVYWLGRPGSRRKENVEIWLTYLAARVLLYDHPTDRITHTTVFVSPVVEHWLEREIAHHERTLLLRTLLLRSYRWKENVEIWLTYPAVGSSTLLVLLLNRRRKIPATGGWGGVRVGGGGVRCRGGWVTNCEVMFEHLKEVFYLTTHATHFIYC